MLWHIHSSKIHSLESLFCFVLKKAWQQMFNYLLSRNLCLPCSRRMFEKVQGHSSKSKYNLLFSMNGHLFWQWLPRLPSSRRLHFQCIMGTTEHDLWVRMFGQLFFFPSKVVEWLRIGGRAWSEMWSRFQMPPGIIVCMYICGPPQEVCLFQGIWCWRVQLIGSCLLPIIKPVPGNEEGGHVF